MSGLVALGDLPLGLLARLDLGRPMLNHAEDRPACAGETGNTAFTLTDTRNFSLAQAVALRFCRRCPLLVECRRYADTRKEEGVWGGQMRRRTRLSYQVYSLFGPVPELPRPGRPRKNAA